MSNSNDFVIGKNNVLKMYSGRDSVITIPDGVKRISYKFGSYNSEIDFIKKVIMPQGVKTIEARVFTNCIALEEVVLSDGLEKIEAYAFEGCSSLKSIVIPDTVKSIGVGVFKNCSALQEILVGENNRFYTSINGVLYSKDKSTLICYPEGLKIESVDFLNNVTRIDDYALAGHKELISFNCADTILEFGTGVFKNCSSLKKVKIPRHFKNISNETFENCSSLEEIELPEGITSIEGNAFSGCTSLKYISFPKKLERIGGGAFKDCKSLENVDFSSGLKEVGVSAFSGCKSLTSVEIPGSVEKIENTAFENCVGLSSVVLNEGVAKLGSEAFKLCENLKDIKLPNSIVEFGSEVFANCKALETFIMPDSVKYVDGGVFLKCTNLHDVVLSSHLREFPELGYTVKSIFKDCNSLFSIVFPKMILKLQKGYFDENIKLSRIYANAESLRSFPQLKKYMLAAYISGDGAYNEEDIKAYELSLKRNAGLVLCHAAEKDDIAVLKALLSKHTIDVSVIIKAIDSTKNEEVKMLLEQYIDTNFSEEDVAIAKKDKERIDVGANSYTLKEARLLYQVGKGEKDDECIIRKYKGEDRDEIIIPSFIDNKKVVMIDKYAFKEKIIKKVVIPDTVKEIGQSAFNRCCIRELVLSNNLEKIGSYAFWNHELDKVVIPKSVRNMGQQLFDYAKNESFTIYYYNAAFKNNLIGRAMENTANCILLKDDELPR